MKNFKKIIALCTLVTLCFTLTGCAFSTFDMTTPLAEQRAQHGIWVKKDIDGRTRTTITYNSQSYLALSLGIELYITETLPIVVTEPDVPLLLREWQGDWLSRSADNQFIIDENGYGTTYYCREDCHEAYEKRFASPFIPTVYGYEYDENWQTHFQKITNDDLTLLMSIKNATSAVDGNDTALTAPRHNYQAIDLTYEEQPFATVAVIYGCSEDLLQRTPMLEVAEHKGELYVSYQCSTLMIYINFRP